MVGLRDTPIPWPCAGMQPVPSGRVCYFRVIVLALFANFSSAAAKRPAHAAISVRFPKNICGQVAVVFDSVSAAGSVWHRIGFLGGLDSLRAVPLCASQDVSIPRCNRVIFYLRWSRTDACDDRTGKVHRSPLIGSLPPDFQKEGELEG
jgi:hypothetical protein